MSIDPNQTLHIKSGVKVDDTLTTAQKLGIGTEAPSAAAHVYGTGAGAAVVVQESTVNSGVARVDVVDKTVRIQAGLTPSNDSKANVEISSYGGATKYVEIDTVTGGPRGNVHVNADLRAPNVYAETLYIESLAIGEVTQGFDEVLNTNNEAANTIYVSNSTAATSLTTGAVRVVGGIATQGNVYADAVYTANLFSTTDELNLSSDVVKLGNKIELGYGNAENTDHNIGVLMTARQQFWSNVATADIASPQTSSAGAFGYSVSVSRDGDRFVAGSHRTGHAYVYHRDPLTGTWPSTPTATFTAPNASTHFGIATLISPDGTRAFVGARLNDEGGSNIGRAYAYSYENGLWNTTPVDLPGQYAGEQMGWSLACNEDGTVVAVGARYNDEGGTDYGRVYVFEETLGNWNTTPIIDIPGTTTDEEFGVALDMNDAGTRLVVGVETTTVSGAAYVFHKTNGTWPTTATATLTGKGVAADLFGSAVKMNATGTRIVVAARVGDYARVYEYDTSTSAWNTTHVAEFSSPKLGDLFGLSCAMNDAGDRVAIGARYSGLKQQGTVTVYEEVNGAWREAHRFYGHEAYAYLGGGLTGVSFNGTGDILVAGAIGYEDAVGRVYVFEQIAASNVAAVYDGHDTLKIGFTSNVVTDAVVDTNASNLHVEIAGDLTLSGSANVFLSNASAIHANSNVVTEFRASKKLIKYPRVAMTSTSQDGYVVTTSSADTSSERTTHGAFDGIFDDSFGEGWQSGTRYSTTTGEPITGSDNATFTANGVDYFGQWVKLQLPTKICVKSIVLSSAYDTNSTDDRRPENGAFLGSNDDTNWELITSFNNDLNYVDSVFGQNSVSARCNSQATISGITNTSHYKYIMLVVTKIATTNQYGPVHINELEYYGLPETDDDPGVGTDVIVRSIPSVPNTDWLEVYYDGQDYGSMPSTITDKSGNAVTGTPRDVTFDATWKAFQFNGTSSNVVATLPSTLTGDDFVHSVSVWFRAESAAFEDASVFCITGPGGTESTSNVINFRTYNPGTAYNCSYIFWNNDVRFNAPLKLNTWHHACLTYTAGGDSTHNRSLFIDGNKIPALTVFGTNAGDPLVFDASSVVHLGSRSASHHWDGSIANFRLFNRALSADEVWQLYAYQKEYFQVSPDVVTFKGGRLGIGTYHPEAVLDVRGNILLSGALYETNRGVGGNAVFERDGHRVHVFTGSGTFRAYGITSVDVLVVGGGGGGGFDNSGGGGAGGVIFRPKFPIKNGEYVALVGGGGYGEQAQAGIQTNGSNSTFSTLTALGGGSGATGNANITTETPRQGGSGGGGQGETPSGRSGASGIQTTSMDISPDSRTYGFGNAGGNGGSASNNEGGGGGGGAGETGANASGNDGGRGGDGIYQATFGGVTYDFYTMYGTNYGDFYMNYHDGTYKNNRVYFGGGGAGGNSNTDNTDTPGGLGGGGGNLGENNANSYIRQPLSEKDGAPNTGGGGAGGTSAENHRFGGNGGSGIIIVRYAI